MRYEDPQALLNRLSLGREELFQRLLTMLILGALVGAACPVLMRWQHASRSASPPFWGDTCRECQ